MAIYDGTFTLYELLVASKLNTMIAGINAHVHDDLYYTETEVDTNLNKVKASSSDGTANYLDSKVDTSTVKVTADKLKLGTVFGAWQGAPASPAPTDGILCAYSTVGTTYGYGHAGTPTGMNVANQGHGVGAYGVTLFVKKGDTWNTATLNTRYWLPIGV